MAKHPNLFTNALKNILEKKGLSQADLARSMNEPSSMISIYYTGKTKPSIDMIVRFAGALGVEPWELLIDYEKNATPAGVLDSYRATIENQGKEIQRLSDDLRKLSGAKTSEDLERQALIDVILKLDKTKLREAGGYLVGLATEIEKQYLQDQQVIVRKRS